jgi:hypothetical protein
MNVGKGRKEWRHFAEVDKENRDGDRDRTSTEVTMRNPDRGEGGEVNERLGERKGRLREGAFKPAG